MAVRLHRCSNEGQASGHPCWKVQKALDDAGVDYQVARPPSSATTRRMTGQRKYPAIEARGRPGVPRGLEGMAATIAAGRFDEKRSRLRTPG
jgi:hypothetical protein